jgi:hypothetical protein
MVSDEDMSSFDLSGNQSSLQHFSAFDIRLTPCYLTDKFAETNDLA